MTKMTKTTTTTTTDIVTNNNTSRTMMTTTTSTSTTATVQHQQQQQPLNVYKKIPVIRFSSDVLSYDDNEGNTKTVSVQELGDAITSTTAATPSNSHGSTTNTSNNNNNNTTTKPIVKLDIPVPKIVNVDEYDNDVSATYQVDQSYVRYHRQTPEVWNTTLEYIADLEDEIWLTNNVDFGSIAIPTSSSLQVSDGNNNLNYITNTSIDTYNNNNNNNNNSFHHSRTDGIIQPSLLPLRIFERMMDIFEKATAFESIITEAEAEQLLSVQLPQLFHLFPSSTTLSITHFAQAKISVTVQHVLKQVYTYWVNKRSKLKRPLLRKYWPVTSTDDTNPHLVFRPRNEKEKYKLRVRKTRTVAAQAAAAAAGQGGASGTGASGGAGGIDSTTSGTVPTTTVADIVLNNTVKRLRLLKDDMLNYTTTLEIIVKREEIYQLHVSAIVELFEQRFYNIVDTSNLQRKSKRLKRSTIVNDVLASSVPTVYEPSTTTGRRTIRRIVPYPTMFTPIPLLYASLPTLNSASTTTTPTTPTTTSRTNFVQKYLKKFTTRPSKNNNNNNNANENDTADDTNDTETDLVGTIGEQGQVDTSMINTKPLPNYKELIPNIAGKNFGDPAPNFLHPLQSREYYTTSYDTCIGRYDSVPCRPTFEHGQQLYTDNVRFRHRPRIGRGGRVIIDRHPQNSTVPSILQEQHLQQNQNQNSSQPPQPTVLRAGLPLPNYTEVKHHLLDLLPRPLDSDSISRNIEAICIAALHEDHEANQNALRHLQHQQQQQQQRSQQNHRTFDSDKLKRNDDHVVEQVLVRLEDYLDTDDQIWGKEQYSIGPI